jgi:hypothetical protein
LIAAIEETGSSRGTAVWQNESQERLWEVARLPETFGDALGLHWVRTDQSQVILIAIVSRGWYNKKSCDQWSHRKMALFYFCVDLQMWWTS